MRCMRFAGLCGAAAIALGCGGRPPAPPIDAPIVKESTPLPFLSADFDAVLQVRPRALLTSALFEKFKRAALPKPEGGAVTALLIGDLHDMSMIYRLPFLMDGLGAKLKAMEGIEEFCFYREASPESPMAPSHVVAASARTPISFKEFATNWVRSEGWVERDLGGRKMLVVEREDKWHRDQGWTERKSADAKPIGDSSKGLLLVSGFGGPTSVCLADARTILFGPAAAVLKALESKPAPSPLAELAAKRKFAGQLRFLLTGETAKRTAENFVGAPRTPDGAFVERFPGLKGAAFQVDLEGEGLFVVDLEFADPAAAGPASQALSAVWKDAVKGFADGCRSWEEPFGEKGGAALQALQDGAAVSAAGGAATLRVPRPAGLAAAVDDVFGRVVPAWHRQVLRARQVNQLRGVLSAVREQDRSRRRKWADLTTFFGRPRLSWRVSLFPLLDPKGTGAPLNAEEAWDGPHNRTLHASLYSEYLAATQFDHANTRVFAVRGPGTAFDAFSKAPDDGRPPFSDPPEDVAALFIVKESLAAPWMKPVDLQFDPADPKKLLDSLPERNIVVGFMDGRVEVWRERPSAETLKALVLCDDGATVEHPK